MSGTISVHPSPATRGQPITIKVDGASPGKSITLTGTDENGNSFTVPVSIDATGSGSATTTISSNWGATLEISGPGLQSYTGTVQGPQPTARQAQKKPAKKATSKKTPRAPAKKPPARSAAKGRKR